MLDERYIRMWYTVTCRNDRTEETEIFYAGQTYPAIPASDKTPWRDRDDREPRRWWLIYNQWLVPHNAASQTG